MDNLRNKLEYHYKAYNKEKHDSDPVEFPHRYKNDSDIEAAAFLTSIFSYGNVKQIKSTLNRLFDIFDQEPGAMFLNNKVPYRKIKNISHRFYNEDDIKNILKTIELVYSTYGSLKFLFLLYYFPGDINIKTSLSHFSKNLKNIADKTDEKKINKFIFPDPDDGSACKRMNLFLRWMVRKDNLDFGIWDEVNKSELVIPVDVHISRIARELKLTERKNADWKMAEEITFKLKKYSPLDPVKYDFALCHIGMNSKNFYD